MDTLKDKLTANQVRICLRGFRSGIDTYKSACEAAMERVGDQSRDKHDLEEAIKNARQAVNATPHDHPDRAGYLINLANMLGRWFEQSGEINGLEEAIDTARQAVQSTPFDHPSFADYLDNLGSCLRRRLEVPNHHGLTMEEFKRLRTCVEDAANAAKLDITDLNWGQFMSWLPRITVTVQVMMFLKSPVAPRKKRLSPICATSSTSRSLEHA
jgi:tetratricopeptide (TPR) repeat protein